MKGPLVLSKAVRATRAARRFVRSREWPPTSGVAVRSVFGLLFGVFGIVLGVVRLDPNYFLVSLIALPAIALWPKQHGGPPK